MSLQLPSESAAEQMKCSVGGEELLYSYTRGKKRHLKCIHDLEAPITDIVSIATKILQSWARILKDSTTLIKY